MNLVSFALRRPIWLLMTIVAAALLGLLAIDRMARDIFPDLGVPVLYVAQPYGGLDPAQMEGFIVSYYEYHFLFITGIEHVESKSIQGVGRKSGVAMLTTPNSSCSLNPLPWLDGGTRQDVATEIIADEVANSSRPI